MAEWFKVISGIKDPLLLVLAMVVLVVLWMSFRLLQTVVTATTNHVVVAINALTEEIKILSKDQTRLAGLVDNVMRHQEWCNNRPRKKSAADGDEGE